MTLDQLVRDLRYAVRTIFRARVFAVVAILTRYSQATPSISGVWKTSFPGDYCVFAPR